MDKWDFTRFVFWKDILYCNCGSFTAMSSRIAKQICSFLKPNEIYMNFIWIIFLHHMQCVWISYDFVNCIWGFFISYTQYTKFLWNVHCILRKLVWNTYALHADSYEISNCIVHWDCTQNICWIFMNMIWSTFKLDMNKVAEALDMLVLFYLLKFLITMTP